MCLWLLWLKFTRYADLKPVVGAKGPRTLSEYAGVMAAFDGQHKFIPYKSVVPRK